MSVCLPTCVVLLRRGISTSQVYTHLKCWQKAPDWCLTVLHKLTPVSVSQTPSPELRQVRCTVLSVLHGRQYLTDPKDSPYHPEFQRPFLCLMPRAESLWLASQLVVTSKHTLKTTPKSGTAALFSDSSLGVSPTAEDPSPTKGSPRGLQHPHPSTHLGQEWASHPSVIQGADKLEHVWRC